MAYGVAVPCHGFSSRNVFLTRCWRQQRYSFYSCKSLCPFPEGNSGRGSDFLNMARKGIHGCHSVFGNHALGNPAILRAIHNGTCCNKHADRLPCASLARWALGLEPFHAGHTQTLPHAFAAWVCVLPWVVLSLPTQNQVQPQNFELYLPLAFGSAATKFAICGFHSPWSSGAEPSKEFPCAECNTRLIYRWLLRRNNPVYSTARQRRGKRFENVSGISCRCCRGGMYALILEEAHHIS